MSSKLVIGTSQLAMARRLVKLDERSLYETLGMQSLGLENPFEVRRARGRAAFSLKAGFAEKKGRSLFKRWSKQLRKAICKEWKYCERAEQYERDFDGLIKELVPVVAAALALTKAVIGLVIVVCVLLFRYGLRRFCRCPP